MLNDLNSLFLRLSQFLGNPVLLILAIALLCRFLELPLIWQLSKPASNASWKKSIGGRLIRLCYFHKVENQRLGLQFIFTDLALLLVITTLLFIFWIPAINSLMFFADIIIFPNPDSSVLTFLFIAIVFVGLFGLVLISLFSLTAADIGFPGLLITFFTLITWMIILDSVIYNIYYHSLHITIGPGTLFFIFYCAIGQLCMFSCRSLRKSEIELPIPKK